MVYDIGLAYGHNKTLQREVLMYIIASAMGNATGALAVMHGSKVLIKRASLRVFQQIVKGLAGKITQKVLASAFAKFVPVLGAVVLATWSKFSTTAIGKKAAELFAQDIQFDENSEISDIDAIPETELKPESSTEIVTAPLSVEKEKTLCLIALMKIDGQIKAEEIEFVKPFIESLNFPYEEKQAILNMTTNTDKVNFNLDAIKNDPSESITLLIDLIALAKRDNEFHVTEKMFIRQIGKQLNFTDDEINEMM